MARADVGSPKEGRIKTAGMELSISDDIAQATWNMRMHAGWWGLPFLLQRASLARLRTHHF